MRKRRLDEQEGQLERLYQRSLQSKYDVAEDADEEGEDEEDEEDNGDDDDEEEENEGEDNKEVCYVRCFV